VRAKGAASRAAPSAACGSRQKLRPARPTTGGSTREAYRGIVPAHARGPVPLTVNDAQLMERLAACTLSRDEWSHVLHVRTAYLFLRRDPFPEALEALRSAIQRLNRSNAVPEARDSGYHETVTVAWLRLVRSRMNASPEVPDSEAFCAASPELLDKHLLRAHYSPARIGSWDAKQRFIEPDLAPLPEVADVDPLDPAGVGSEIHRDRGAP